MSVETNSDHLAVHLTVIEKTLGKYTEILMAGYHADHGGSK
jgi:hypothetical protein